MGRDDEVGRERERAADPGGGPVDGRDDRLRHVADRVDDRVVALAQALREVEVPVVVHRVGGALAGLGQVGAGGERPARAGEEHCAHRLVGGDRLERPAQVLAELEVPCVEGVGAVQLDRRDAVRDLEVDGFEAAQALAFSLGFGLGLATLLYPPSEFSR